MRVWSINSLNFILGMTAHKYLPLPAPTPAMAGHIEGGVPMGFSSMFRKISNDVMFDGSYAVLLGHDIGFFIPHYNVLPPAPPNTLLAVIIPFSSCKVTFGQSKVLVNELPAGAWFPVLQNGLACADPAKLPLDFLVDAAFRNTVVFNFKWVDFGIGLLYTGFEIGSSYLLGKLCKSAGGGWLSNTLGQPVGYLLGQQLLGRLGIELSEVAVEKFVEKAYSTLLQKTVLKWLVTGPVGDLIKGLNTSPMPTPKVAAPHDAIVQSAPVVNEPPTDGGLPPAGTDPEGAGASGPDINSGGSGGVDEGGFGGDDPAAPGVFGGRGGGAGSSAGRGMRGIGRRGMGAMVRTP